MSGLVSRVLTSFFEDEGNVPQMFQKDDGTFWIRAADGTEAQVGSGGAAPGTVLPVADPTGVTVDTTTYDNPITGVGKLTTLVFPQTTGAFAIALEGDAFPRYIFPSDPVGGDLLMGDGTFDPYNDNGAYIGIGRNGDGSVILTLGGGNGVFTVGNQDANRGYLYRCSVAGTAGHATWGGVVTS